MPFIIGTAGHIDHGKTSLIKALTGIETDRLKEEKERGISIDLGFAYFDLPNPPSPMGTDLKSVPKGGKGGFTRVGIVDVPGHERFIKNMLAGATGIDLVLFVVAADDGVMPQTREHLDIMHLLGISNGIFVITKSDLVDERQVNKVTADVKELIHGTCLKDSPIVPVSSATGFGIDNLKKLISTEAQKVLSKPEGGFFRLPIDRSFSIKGFGTVVTGTVGSGSIQKNADAAIISKKIITQKKVKIRGMQSHSKEVNIINAGQRAAMNLSGISHTDIKRGDMLVSTDLNMLSSIVDVSFEFLPVGTDVKSVHKPIKNYSMLKLHHLTSETIAKVVFVDMSEAIPGTKVFGQIRLKEPKVMMRGDRFILRDPAINATVGGGRVLLPFAIKRKASDIKRYEVLDSQDLIRILKTILSDTVSSSVDSRTIRLMLNVSEKKLKELITPIGMDEEWIVQIGERLVLKDKIKEIEQLIVNVIQKYHLEMSGDIGIDENSLVRSGLKTIDSNIIQAIVKDLINVGKVVKRANILSLPFHKSEAKGIEKEIEDAILAAFLKEGFNPLKLDDVLQFPSYKKDDVKKVFQLLLKRGMVTKITENSYISKAKLDEAKEKLIVWVSEKGKIKAAEFRDILGCGRKFAIELLEYFDKEKITLRSGDYRVLRKILNVKQ